MQYIVDGLIYDEYPDELERIANLRDSNRSWCEYATELQKKIWALEEELAKVAGNA